MVCVECGLYMALPDEILCKNCYAAKVKAISKHDDRRRQYADERLLHKSTALWNEYYEEIQFPFVSADHIPVDSLPQSFKDYIESYEYLFNFGKCLLFSSNKDYKLLIYSIIKHLFLNFHIKSAKDEVSNKARLVEIFNIRFMRTLEFNSMYAKDINKESDIIQSHLLVLQIDDCSYTEYAQEIFNNIVEWRGFSDTPILFFTPLSIELLKSQKMFKKIITNPKIKLIKGV